MEIGEEKPGVVAKWRLVVFARVLRAAEKK